MLTITDKRRQRFWDKVNKTPICWLWTGSKTKDGYGKVSFTESDSKYTFRAHRFAYLISIENPANKLVCHTCDNPLCVNVGHLFLGSNTDNQQDMIRKERHNRAKGEKLSGLTNEKVLEIRTLHSQGQSQRKLAKQFGLTYSGIWHIVNRTTWKHI